MSAMNSQIASMKTLILVNVGTGVSMAALALGVAKLT